MVRRDDSQKLKLVAFNILVLLVIVAFILFAYLSYRELPQKLLWDFIDHSENDVFLGLGVY